MTMRPRSPLLPVVAAAALMPFGIHHAGAQTLT